VGSASRRGDITTSDRRDQKRRALANGTCDDAERSGRSRPVSWSILSAGER